MILITLFGLILICFASIGARSTKSFSRHKLDDFCRRRHSEKRLVQMLKEYDRVAAAAGMFRLLCTVLLLLAGVCVLLRDGVLRQGDYGNWAVYAGLAFLALLVAEFWLPRNIAKLWGTYFAYYTWPFWRFLATLLAPLTFLDRFFSIVFHRLAGETEETDDEEAFEDEIRTMVTEGHREGLLEEEAREMIEGVMELSDFTVSEIMTPRTDMVCISDALSWDEMLAEVISSPHSRFPVYGENRDDIIGVIHTKDLLRELAQRDPASRRAWTDLMKGPLFVPETKPVDTLLQEFQNTNLSPTGSGDNGSSGCGSSGDDDDPIQRAKGHLAIVLDEYGGVSGIVTLEDILEEIVGEILDEHDPVIETEDIREVGLDVFESLGKVRIDDLNEAISLDLPEEEDYDTIAGFIFSTLGHVPEVGEHVDYEHDGKRVRFTVLEATRRRIEKVRVERNPAE